MATHIDIEGLRLPLRIVHFPLELRIPPQFAPEDPTTWPKVEGSLELVDGRLWYMPPTGDIQQDVVPAVSYVLFEWAKDHPEIVVAGSEAGMILGGDIRGADAALFRRSDLPPRTGKLRRVPPVLAVEVAGEDDEEETLRRKAAWYLAHGVRVVWLVLPATREVIVLAHDGETRCARTERLPPRTDLPGLEPDVARFFAQLDE